MASSTYTYDDTDPTYDERDEAVVTPQSAASTAFQQPSSSVLPNPVPKSFQTPAQPALDTVPTPVQPQPQLAPDAPQYPAAPPRVAPVQPFVSSAPAVPAASASSFQIPLQPVTPATPANPFPLPPTPYSAPAPVSGVYRPADAPQFSAADFQAQQDEQRAQYARDQAANLKFFKSQGAQTEVTPTGQEQLKLDADGNPLYHPAVVQPFLRGEDGKGYRVSRDEYNNQHFFDLSQGAEGQDFHVDPQSGEMYVDVSGAEGGSKREVIGQNPYVPRINALASQLQDHRDTSQALDLAINQATHGVQGGSPMQAASLQDLREQATSMRKGLKPLQEQLSDLESYAPDGDSAANPADLSEKRQLQDQVRFRQAKLDAVQGEVDARDGTIADAQQQRDALSVTRGQATRQMGVLQAARRGRMNLQQDLATVATGGMIDATQAKILSNAGLVVPDRQEDGSVILRVSREATGLLDENTRTQVKANPTGFNVMAEATPQVAASVKAVARQLPKAETEDTSATVPAEVTAARQQWQRISQNVMRQVPGIGVAGSPQNVAFVRAFRQSGGDVGKALKAAVQGGSN